MLDIFRKIKIRYLILLNLVLLISMLFIKLIFNLRSGTAVILYDGLIILWIIFMIFKHKNSYKFNLSEINTKNVRRDILKIYIYTMVFAVAINCIITGILYIIKPSWMVDVLNATPLEENMYMNFLKVVIIAPILEELIFRGIIFSRLSKNGGYVVAAITSSVIFGLLHIEMAIIGAMVFGICQCILFKKYDNIVIPIIVHFLNNFILMMIVVVSNFIGISRESESITNIAISNSDIAINLVLGIILIIPSSILIIKYIKNNRLNKEQHLSSEKNIVNEIY